MINKVLTTCVRKMLFAKYFDARDRYFLKRSIKIQNAVDEVTKESKEQSQLAENQENDVRHAILFHGTVVHRTSNRERKKVTHCRNS